MLVRNDLTDKKSSFTFTPDFMADSVTDIDFEHLRERGITTCFIDLDGTVVDRGSFEVDPELGRALKNSKMAIKIATNRPRSRSLKRLKEDLSASGVIHPHGIWGKPSKRYIRTALKEIGCDKSEVIMIGDRFIQDILGANRSGIYSLAVYKLGRSIGPIDKFISNTEKRFFAKTKSSYKKV